ASVEAATDNGTTRDTCLRSRASTHASSSNSGISPAMCTGREDGSKREMRFTPDLPARRARQKASLPMPLGLTTPSPVITTRGTIVFVCFNNDRKPSAHGGSSTSCVFHATRSGIMSHDVPGPLYLGAVLPDQVYILQ